MRHQLICHFILLQILAALPAAAQPAAQELVAAADMVRVVTRHSRAADCIAPLSVNRIDGEPASVAAEEFLIEAGVHSINGRATLDTSKCPVELSKLRISRVADLEVNFETGYTYYIGYDYTSPDPAQWRLVAWRVEQSKGSFMPVPAGEVTGELIQ
ncbi:MAG: hypothetical protein HKP21_12885 [Xanthomonadales bacterium]|nr:hypothetical protein [Gammaproteobacteria bacterium]NNK05444.1 hypothetical protein [Xanthomonadales bacterium]